MPDLFEIIETCRAMRRLKPDPVPDELISKILHAGICAPNGGNTQRWRFLVIKDKKIKQAVQVFYKRAFDEVIGPRYLTSQPPPGVTKERYLRQHAAVAYLTDHFAEAPVWIVACLEDGPNPNRAAGSSIYPAVQNMVLAARALGLGTHVDDPPSPLRKGSRGRPRPAERRALLCDPPDRLPDGQVRPGRPRPAQRDRLPGSLGRALSRRLEARRPAGRKKRHGARQGPTVRCGCQRHALNCLVD